MHIIPLSKALASTYIEYMKHMHFDHAPEWAGCYCQFYHTTCTDHEWQSRTKETNEALAYTNIESGKLKGYLAYEGDRCIGWLNANDALAYDRLLPFVSPLVEDGHRVGLMICFVIDPEFRRRGVASALVERALLDFAAKGYDSVIVSPFMEDASKGEPQLKGEKHYRGHLSMYQKFGFKSHPKDTNVLVKDLVKLNVISMYSPELEVNKTLRIMLPPNYNPQKKYAVIYMHDGQNLFDRSTSAYGEIWDAHIALANMAKESQYEAIVVGIDNSHGYERLQEYSPWLCQVPLDEVGFPEELRHLGGKGDRYAHFVVNRVKPYIDHHYSTLADWDYTWVIGSSMGGLISLYMGLEYPHIFSKIGAFSTASWFAKPALIQAIQTKVKENNQSKKIKWYLDAGTQEGKPERPDLENHYVNDAIEVSEQLIEAGIPADNVKLIIEKDAIHNERDWARRLPYALTWLNS